jgi:hypothetical protein
VELSHCVRMLRGVTGKNVTDRQNRYRQKTQTKKMKGILKMRFQVPVYSYHFIFNLPAFVVRKS